jgi:hypothetical protein
MNNKVPCYVISSFVHLISLLVDPHIFLRIPFGNTQGSKRVIRDSLVLFTKYYGDQINEDEMGGACSTHGKDMHTVLLFGNLKGRDHLEDVGIDGKVILEWILGENGGKVWTG